MVEPVKELPKKTPPKTPPKIEQPPPEKTARTTPTRGDEVRRGEAIAETNVRGQGFNSGLAAGAGGLGARVDAGNFCCPQYLVQIVARIRENWDSRQANAGRTGLRFVVQRDGTIVSPDVELSSGSGPLDLLAVRAVRLAKQLPPLPPEYPNEMLTVHLTFEYQR
jgi:TonB family protein